MTVDLSQFIPSFLEESFEGLELMESSLLNLTQSEDDEVIHSIFRAAHSIKGGAGTFGFEHVTEFTHLVETLLDEMRDGRREIVQSDVEILLVSVDCIRMLIEAIRDETDYDQEKIQENAKLLEGTLSMSAVSDSTNNSLENSEDECGSEQGSWQITFIPEHHLVQTGNDPIFLFSALEEFGELAIEAITSELPCLDNIDPEELYLSWRLTLISDCSEDDIREVFEWVEDECELQIQRITSDGAISDVAQSNTITSEPETEPQSATTSKEDVQAADPIEIPQEQNTKQLTEQPLVDKQPVSKAEPANKSAPAKSKTDVGSIRVGVDKVDSLINLVGELVITQSMLSELGNDFDISKLDRLTSGLEQLLQNTKELQESVMRIRMLPISFAFNRFPRLIHDLSMKTGKEIELVINGEQTELDKTVMEQIGDPLVHLVRNAVDHGIEPSEVRLSKGKPEKGTVELDAYHQGGNIVIEIKDDGGGINRDAVLSKAIEKGLVDASAVLTDSQVFELILEPGFSTAKEISDISGRGVGMDVVKKNIQALGGRIQVESQPDKGSTFRIHLPLTLAILDGQLIKVGTEIYVIPLITIVESLQTKSESINRVSGDMVLYRLREDNVPVIPIHQLFNIPADNETIENALLVVVEADGQKVGLMVDDLLAQQQVVIKSLKDNYQQVNGISGATILGDGSVAMILDVPGLINMAMERSNERRNNHFRNSRTAGEAK